MIHASAVRRNATIAWQNTRIKGVAFVKLAVDVDRCMPLCYAVKVTARACTAKLQAITTISKDNITYPYDLWRWKQYVRRRAEEDPSGPSNANMHTITPLNDEFHAYSCLFMYYKRFNKEHKLQAQIVTTSTPKKCTYMRVHVDASMPANEPRDVPTLRMYGLIPFVHTLRL